MRVPWPAARTTTAATLASGVVGTDVSCGVTGLLGRGQEGAALGDSDSNRDCTAPKAGGLPITPSPTRGADDRRGGAARRHLRGSLGPGASGSTRRDRDRAATGGWILSRRVPYGDVGYGHVACRRAFSRKRRHRSPLC